MTWTLAVGPHRAQGVVAVCRVAAGDAHGEPGRGADGGVVRIHAEAVVKAGGLLLAEAARGVCTAQGALFRRCWVLCINQLLQAVSSLPPVC